MQRSFVSYTGIVLLFAILTIPLVWDLGLRGIRRFPMPPSLHVPGGNAERGRQAIRQYGCGSCHTVPGIRIATGRVGPQLHGFRDQLYIAGVLANTPENLIAWIQNPRDINPRTAMPDLGVTESDARDMAAYIYNPRAFRWREDRGRPVPEFPFNRQTSQAEGRKPVW